MTKDYPWYTPYQFAGNRPIDCIDLDGAEPWKKNSVGICTLGIPDGNYSFEQALEEGGNTGFLGGGSANIRALFNDQLRGPKQIGHALGALNGQIAAVLFIVGPEMMAAAELEAIVSRGSVVERPVLSTAKSNTATDVEASASSSRPTW